MTEPQLHHGDCLDVLAGFEPESFDAFVDDPPAGIAMMGRTWDDLRGYKPRTERGREVLAGLGLLGLAPWAAGFVAFMFEVSVAKLRVAKPGAHSPSWALPRTSDLTMMAMRLAGWEIRDVVLHLFGSGLAKSLDVSKAIDKPHGAEREVLGPGRRHNSKAFGEANGGGVYTGGGVPPITAPATDDARTWDGWGTALSPAAEYWILARAPMAGTVARNVIAHGTGAINIGATRTATTADEREIMDNRSGAGMGTIQCAHAGREAGEMFKSNPAGRWPKNAVLSCALACEGDRHSPGCPRRMIDEMSGTLTTNVTRLAGTVASEGSSGGASRFFPTFGYYPKASDRTIPGRSDITNSHPTIKSPDLMRWLIRLVTPPGGRLLDCFMGSGTTGVACAAEGVDFVGIEADPANFEIARARILAAHGSPEYAAEANAAAPVGSQLGLL